MYLLVGVALPPPPYPYPWPDPSDCATRHKLTCMSLAGRKTETRFILLLLHVACALYIVIAASS